MDRVVQIIESTLMIMCYVMYFYNDRKKDHYNAIKFLMLGVIMQNLVLHF